jgi:Spy/CpxP family protein refolding chaperone
MVAVRPSLDSLGAATRQRIRHLLTPEQQATYDQMLREREEARRQEKRP